MPQLKTRSATGEPAFRPAFCQLLVALADLQADGVDHAHRHAAAGAVDDAAADQLRAAAGAGDHAAPGIVLLRRARHIQHEGKHVLGFAGHQRIEQFAALGEAGEAASAAIEQIELAGHRGELLRR